MTAAMMFRAIGRDVTIYPWARIIAPEAIAIGDRVIIDDFVFIARHLALTLGDCVHIASGARLAGGGVCEIGDYSGVSMGATILSGSDDFLGATLLGPAIPAEFRRVDRSFVRIGRHCVIGAHSVIMPGVTLGDGVAVGAMSLVTHDLPEGWLCWGIPAQPRKRRPLDEIRALEARLRGDR